MLHNKIAAAVTAAAAMFIVGPAAAAQSTTALNVRSGPSTGYSVVDTLYAGEHVDVDHCLSNGWCQITHSGPDGWVSQHYLTGDMGGGYNPPRNGGNSNSADNEPNVNFSVNTPGFSFSIGNGDNNNDYRRNPPYWRYPGNNGRRNAQVCFYEDFNYRGASFCVRPGQQDRRLTGAWNDRVSSIRIIGNAQARVCEDWNFRGRCAVIDNSRPRLPGRNNDAISSYRIQ